MSLDDSEVAKTGQLWKVFLAIGCVLSGCLLFALELNHLTNFVGVGLLLFGVFFGSLSIRCPRCGRRWFWSALRYHPKSELSYWVLGGEHCVGCSNEA